MHPGTNTSTNTFLGSPRHVNGPSLDYIYVKAKLTVGPSELPAEWRQRAQYLDDYGDPNTARLWQLAAAELDEALRTHGEQTLTLVEAAEVSGYTADHIGSLVRNGKLTNHGRPNAPRVRRADIPIKSPSSPGRPAAARRKTAGAPPHAVHNITKLKPGRHH